jgi:hypothetical protein
MRYSTLLFVYFTFITTVRVGKGGEAGRGQLFDISRRGSFRSGSIKLAGKAKIPAGRVYKRASLLSSALIK